MVEIGGEPILWHIMKLYSYHGFRDFIICCGYKGHMIKDYFVNYVARTSDLTIDLERNHVDIHRNTAEPWRVTVIDTGLDTMTGGRLRRVKHLLGDGTFLMTYGDGVSDINLTELVDFHRAQGSLATLTAVQPPGRFGAFTLADDENMITSFREKPQGDGAWINGGFFVLEPEAIEYIADDAVVWETGPLTALAHDHKLAAYKHYGFWQSMDSLRDKMVIESLWERGNAPWKVW